MHVVVGTAGHIDHGKSALVKAMTGTDPDRLKEEKERGMTTDLGFAFLGTDITVIDVPGHERFVRHMLAGASTIDLVVLVVAADDGVMPQTREHFEICRLMGIKKGLVAINKADLVDDEWIEMVKLDVSEMVRGTFLEGAPVMPVSAITGRGVTELRQAIVELAKKVEAKPDRGVFRMPVDRNFSMKGFGTVVAGTVLSGHVHVGDTLELLPQKREVRVRGIQKHNQMLETLGLGERAALNLQGLERAAVVRGNVLATPGYYTPTTNFNAALYLLKSVEKPLRNLASLKLHIGTAEVMCRVALLDTKELASGQDALVQVRAAEPVVCDWNDHYVIRTFAPQQTIGGGVVLEANPSKERRFDEDVVKRLRALATGEAGSVLEQYLLKHRFDAKTLAQAAKDLALADADANEMLALLLATNRARKLAFEAKEFLVHEKMVAEARAALLATLGRFHKDSAPNSGQRRRPVSRRRCSKPCWPGCWPTKRSSSKTTGFGWHLTRSSWARRCSGNTTVSTSCSSRRVSRRRASRKRWPASRRSWRSRCGSPCSSPAVWWTSASRCGGRRRVGGAAPRGGSAGRAEGACFVRSETGTDRLGNQAGAGYHPQVHHPLAQLPRFARGHPA